MSKERNKKRSRTDSNQLALYVPFFSLSPSLFLLSVLCVCVTGTVVEPVCPWDIAAKARLVQRAPFIGLIFDR